MKAILNALFEHKTLNKKEAKEVLIAIANNQYNPSQIAAFMTVFLMRPISVDELIGFQEALLELAIKVDLSDYETIDLCGTGGDGKNTFNISTLTSFIVAGAGYKVAKHGNYGVSSFCGSSNLLAHLGYEFTTDSSILKKQLEEANICFLHAPLFHPAMKAVAPIRKELGLKTFFNILGPLVNPSQPTHQMVGVFNLEVARAYNYVFQQKENKKYTIVHSLDGYDEISLTGDFKIISKEKEQLLKPEFFEKKTIEPEAIFGGNSVESSAKIFTTILNGNGTKEQNDVVLTNAAFAIQTMNEKLNFEQAYEQAESSLFGLKAKHTLDKII
ncbi:anthranilate phosphoribosyltransferase [Aureivirga sp. CE67]|uniref:anthranilate phosphoribosyltransferase n=1 Tax=Aureivirga sp. CE67 TaxID=1788983 RepID=UPI0018CA21BC|nr:anthranilate phosphoribosyltransferase [Aureivirga sp. CE67]